MRGGSGAGEGSPQAYSPSLEHLSSSVSSRGGEAVRERAFRASSFSVASTGVGVTAGDYETPPFVAAYALGGDEDDLPSAAAAVGGEGKVLGVVAHCEVLDVQGNPVTVGKLATAARAHCVLVFAPREAVEVSGLVYAKVAHLLQAAGVRLIFVTAWLPHQARKFLARYERISPFPGTLVCDPDAVLFAHFGFLRSRLGAWAAAIRPSGRPRSRKGTLGRDISSTRTPSARLRSGAVVLRLPTALDVCDASSSSLGAFAPDSGAAIRVVYHQSETPAAGAACHLDVLVACGANGAFVPDIDAAHLCRRFHNMRVTSQKARQADAKEQKALRVRTEKLTARTRTSRQRTWHG